MPTLAILSFRLGGADGVSTEARKWQDAFATLGFHAVTVAGEGGADRIVPGLGLEARDPPSASDLADALEDANIVVVENVCSLPLNAGATTAVARALRGRRAILRHHDLPWQRERFQHIEGVPPVDDQWLHVTINELSRRELEARGISASTIANAFDVDEPPGDREKARETLGIASDERLVLQPTRAIARKNAPEGLALAEALDATYWLLGPTEEGYDDELATVLGKATTRTISGRPPGLSVADLYAAADAVVLPSTFEGFGNATIESAIHHRPLAIHPYPVAAEIAAYGFRWFPSDDAKPLAEWLHEPDDAVLELNHAIARRHFSLDRLTERLAALLRGAGWEVG